MGLSATDIVIHTFMERYYLMSKMHERNIDDYSRKEKNMHDINEYEENTKVGFLIVVA